MNLVGAVIAAHVIIATFIARWAFGRARARILAGEDEGVWHEWETGARIQGSGVVLTMLCLAGMWPLLLMVGIVMVGPPKTPGELQKLVDARDKRVADLERQLGIK